MDFEIREYEHRIIEAINSGNYPLEFKRLIVKEIYEQIEAATEEMIQRQMESEVQKDGESLQENQLGE